MGKEVLGHQNTLKLQGRGTCPFISIGQEDFGLVYKIGQEVFYTPKSQVDTMRMNTTASRLAPTNNLDPMAKAQTAVFNRAYQHNKLWLQDHIISLESRVKNVYNQNQNQFTLNVIT